MPCFTHTLLNHLIFINFFLFSTSIQLIVDKPNPGDLVLLSQPIHFQTHINDNTNDLTPHDYLNLQLCFVHGDFPDLQLVTADINTISNLPSTMQTHCFEKGLLSGVVHLENRGYHRFSMYLKGIRPKLSPVVSTYVQILDYQSSNVTTTIWNGCSDSTQQEKQCKTQLVEIVHGPRKYNVEATAAKGYGIYVAKSLLPSHVANHLIQLANDCTFDFALDTIDKAPSIQVDLWHQNAGVPGPHTASLLLTGEIFRSVMPLLLNVIKSMHSWEPRNVTCTDAFLRRYRPGERLGVKAHQDTSDITVNCLLSSSETGFSGGFVYRFINEYAVDVVPTMQGDCVFHAGQVRHGALPTEVGTRFTLITFWKVKERMKGSTSYEKGETNPGEEEL